MSRVVLGVIGICLALMSGFCSVAFVAALAKPNPGDSPVTFVILTPIALAFTAAGAWMAYANLRRRPVGVPASDFEREQSILRLAEDEGGRVTVAGVAASCHISVAESKQALDRMAAGGVALMHVTDDGLLVYEFPGLRDEEKQSPQVD